MTVCHGGSLQYKFPELYLLIYLSMPFSKIKFESYMENFICRDMDWSLFLKFTRYHRLSGKVIHNSSMASITLPDKIKTELLRDVNSYRKSADDNLEGLLQVSKHLFDAKIKTVLLRSWIKDSLIFDRVGIASAETPYLLVLGENREQVERSLQEIGFSYGEYLAKENLFRTLSPWEITQHPGRTNCPDLFRSEIIRVGETVYSSLKFKLNLCVTNWQIGYFDFESVFDESVHFSELGPGLNVPAPEDIVLYLAYEFYQDCGLRNFGDLRTKRGVLKFLSDFYSGLDVYLNKHGNVSQLTKRAKRINAEMILYYTLYYLQEIYGEDPFASEIMHTLGVEEIGEVPTFVNTEVPIASIDSLIRPAIQTTVGEIETRLAMLNPDWACRWLVDGAKAWNEQGNGLTAVCNSVDNTLIENGLPNENAWIRAEALLIDPKNVDSRQFFCNHISDGFKIKNNNLLANIKLLWDASFLYIRAEVDAERMYYVPSDYIHLFGEQVILYLCDQNDPNKKIKTVGLLVRQDGVILPKKTASQSEAMRQLRRLGVASTETRKDGYRLDFSVSWQELGLMPVRGNSIGFDVEIVHGGPTLGQRTVLAWSGTQRLSASHYGVLGTVSLH